MVHNNRVHSTVPQNLLRSTIVGSAAFNLFIISAASLAEDFEALNYSVGKLSVFFKGFLNHYYTRGFAWKVQEHIQISSFDAKWSQRFLFAFHGLIIQVDKGISSSHCQVCIMAIPPDKCDISRTCLGVVLFGSNLWNVKRKTWVTRCLMKWEPNLVFPKPPLALKAPENCNKVWGGTEGWEWIPRAVETLEAPADMLPLLPQETNVYIARRLR